jgi:Domain of unknown function (DUF4124)
MWGKVVWGAVAVAMVLGGGVKVSAEMYLWTDEQGVVHMTNQWANVPESARARVSVRDSAPPPSEGTPAMEPAARPVEPATVGRPLMQIPPDLAQTPSTVASSPPGVIYPGDSSVLIPNSRPFVHHPRKVSPPFPYNVRLDPIDPNFVWVGRNRVPKDTFPYPRISLDAQAQFRNRLRSLEQRRSVPPATFPTPPIRP